MDFSATRLNDSPADVKTHAESFWVHNLGTFEFSKSLEKLVHFFICYTLSCVGHLNLELFILIVISCDYFDFALESEFEGVLGQIDQDLLEADLITVKHGRELFSALFIIIRRSKQ